MNTTVCDQLVPSCFSLRSKTEPHGVVLDINDPGSRLAKATQTMRAQISRKLPINLPPQQSWPVGSFWVLVLYDEKVSLGRRTSWCCG